MHCYAITYSSLLLKCPVLLLPETSPYLVNMASTLSGIHKCCVTKAMTIHFIDGKCDIKFNLYLSKSLISRYWLLMSLEPVTHTHTHTHMHTNMQTHKHTNVRTKSLSKNQVCGLWPMHNWF